MIIEKLTQVIEGQISGDDARAVICDALKEKDEAEQRYYEIMQLISNAENVFIYGTIERPCKHQTFR